MRGLGPDDRLLYALGKGPPDGIFPDRLREDYVEVRWKSRGSWFVVVYTFVLATLTICFSDLIAGGGARPAPPPPFPPTRPC